MCLIVGTRSAMYMGMYISNVTKEIPMANLSLTTQIMSATTVQDLLDIASEVSDGTNPALELAAHEVATNNGQRDPTAPVPGDFCRAAYARLLGE